MTQVRQQKICLFMVVVQFLFAGVIYSLTIKFQGNQPVFFLQQCVNMLIMGGLISLLAWRHSALSWSAFIERRDSAGTIHKENIFTDEVDMTGRQERAFLQFNKILMPVILVIFSLIEIYLSGRLLFLDPEIIENPQNSLLVPVAIMTALALVLFLSGKYCSGLAFDEKHHFLRPVSGYLLLNAFNLFFALISGLVFYFGTVGLLSFFLWFSIILSLILAVERILLWVVDLYRPKLKNEEYLPIYESRILALFSQPKGVFGNLSSMLEYQFGISISESLFSVFAKKVLLPFLCIQLISLFLLSSLTYIRPFEKGLKFSVGEQKFDVLEPGLHVNAPWPFCNVERYDVKRVKEINLTEDPQFTEEFKIQDADVWGNESYGKLVSMTVEKDSNGSYSQVLAVVDVRLKYSILDVLKFRSAYMNSEQALKMHGRRVLSRLLLEHNFGEVLKGGLGKFSEAIKIELEKTVAADLGVDIVDIEIVNYQPPPEVAEYYQAVYKSIQDGRRLLTQAEKYEVEIVSRAEMYSDMQIKRAQSETLRKTMLLDAELESFKAQRDAYEKLPKIYKTMAKMEVFENWLKDVRKVINLSGADREIIILELKKVGPDLLNLE
ncbi:MAG: SPFH domain-containing protein [Lentisphaeraceae bacterium]|nr:SPFH domain-containing protein [Lentisphaeraceae bacterium]